MKKATKYILAFNGLTGSSVRLVVHGGKDIQPVFEDSMAGKGVPKAARDAAKKLYKKGAFDHADSGGSLFLVNGTWALYPADTKAKLASAR